MLPLDECNIINRISHIQKSGKKKGPLRGLLKHKVIDSYSVTKTTNPPGLRVTKLVKRLPDVRYASSSTD